MLSNPWTRRLLIALGGAVAMIAFGQLASLLGSSCSILCRPPVAGLYGAVVALVSFGGARSPTGPQPP